MTEHNSCSLLRSWCRAMDFITALLALLYNDREVTLSQAAASTYEATLKKFHGMFTSTAFLLALKVQLRSICCAAVA
jgi:Glycolipid transfer protein (GLTP)